MGYWLAEGSHKLIKVHRLTNLIIFCIIGPWKIGFGTFALQKLDSLMKGAKSTVEADRDFFHQVFSVSAMLFCKLHSDNTGDICSGHLKNVSWGPPPPTELLKTMPYSSVEALCCQALSMNADHALGVSSLSEFRIRVRRGYHGHFCTSCCACRFSDFPDFTYFSMWIFTISGISDPL